jgi:hypothetical protein
MPGLGRKTWSPGDTLTASDVNGYLMDQSVMVFAGTAARASAIPTPSAGMVAYSTATGLNVYNGSAWVGLSTGYGVASGGSATSISVGGTAYTLLTFTSDASLVVSSAGLFDCLLVGGGGGGGQNGFSVNYTGGGGAGGVSNSTVYLAAGTYAVDIGAGGAKAIQGSTSRLDTPFVSLSATGGGRGGGGDPATSGVFQVSSNGGCSGGGAGEPGPPGLAATGAQGFSGGNGVATRGQGAGGGGGGGAVGAVGSGTAGGAGGAGYDATNFVGTSTFYAGGGGGGGASGGAGGSGGGGGRTVAGTANTGGGGGGNNATGSDNAAAGGSGIVLVRFRA